MTARLSDLTRSDWLRLARYAAVGFGCAGCGEALGWLWVARPAIAFAVAVAVLSCAAFLVAATWRKR